MTQLIDKDRVVAEIESYKNSFCDRNGYLEDSETNGLAYDTLCELEDSIDTLEVKEVDLRKEMDKEWNKCKPIDEGMGLEIASIEYEQFDNIAKHFFELGIKLKKIKWKPITEIPTEHWENNPAISPLYLVKCGSINGNSILGYTHYSYVSNSWMDCFHATEDGIWKVLEWTDKRDI